MKVFISWSGDRSRKLAEFLAGWLLKLPLTIVPWVSKEAIDPGTRWGKELAEALEGTSFGILCITPENQKEPWVNFEAGALSKTIEKTYVVPYLIGMEPSDLEQPLRQFQACEATEEGTWRLIETIYMASGDKTRSINDLDESFKMWWPKLEEQIENVKADADAAHIVNQEPSMYDIKSSLDKVITVLESLSDRFIKLESECSASELCGYRAAFGKQRKIRNQIDELKKDINLKDLAIEKYVMDLKYEPAFLKALEKVLFEKSIEKLQEKPLDNDKSKE